ncbi:hypothetical protein BDR05DRAFT_959649, partial [Suillus weaverae]
MSHTIPQVRRRPTKLSPSGARPDSNVVRASVFETALELGIHNSTVANWIFNSPLPEEVEELEDIPPETEAEETLTPALTFGSHTASDESSTTSSPQNNVASARQIHMHKPSVFEPPHVHFNDFASAQLTLSLPPLSTPVIERERLGSMSNSSGKPSNDLGHQSSEDIAHHDRKCATPNSAKSESGYMSDGQYLSDSAGLKKSGKLKGKGKKGKPPVLDLRPGFDEAPGYSSDGGYLSASSNKSQGKSSKGKSRAMAFFRRKPKKQRASDEEDDNYIPPVPAMPPMAVPSSPRPLKHLVATPSSPTRSGFTPLTLNFNTSTRASSPVLHSRKDRVSPPLARVATPSPTPAAPRPSEQTVNSMPSPSPSPVPPSTSTSAPALPSMLISHAPIPNTPFSAVSPPIPQAPVTPLRSSPIASPRHIAIRPAAPPPTQPLPQPPPSPMPSTPSRRAPGPPPTQALPPVPARPLPMPPSTPTTPSRRLPPFRPVVVPGPTAPLVPRRNPQAQPRVLFSPRPQPSHSASDSVVPQYTHGNGEASPRRYQSHSAVPSDDSSETHPSRHGGMVRRQHSEMPPPPFLQRRMHGVQGSPRHPPPDSPLPQVPNARPMHPPAFPSKFHEHFSSVSSMGHTSPALLTPRSTSRSGSSSGPSVRSIRSSNAPSVSTSDSHGHSSRHSGGVIDTRPETRYSSRSETSYGKQITASIAYSHSHSSMIDTRSEISASVYDERSSTYDEEGGNDPNGAQANDEKDDDASFYPSDEKTAGRRTMYLVENGQAL